MAMPARKTDRRQADGAARRLDRKARISGLVYLTIAVGVAIVHDEILKLPAGDLSRAGTQISFAIMVVLGMLGGLLVCEGRSLFGRLDESSRRQNRVATPRTRARRSPSKDSLFDTRSGVAMAAATRALAAASRRRKAGIAEIPAGAVDG